MLNRYNFASSSFEFSTFLSSRNAKKIVCSPHFHLLHLSGVILQDYYLCFGVKCQLSVIWGHMGQKVIFTKKCYDSSLLCRMTLRLVHVHQLETLYLCYGVKCQTGSFGAAGVKRSLSLNMLWLVRVTQHDHKTHTCASTWDPLPILWGQMSTWGHLGSQCQKAIFTKNSATRQWCYIAWP